MAEARTATERVRGLDELRGLAIVAVLLSHVGLVFGGNVFGARTLTLGVGVDLFFVISGFVIVQSAQRLRETAGGEFWRAAAAFWARRVARVALPAWAVVAAIGAVEALGSGLGATTDDLRAAAGFFGNFHWGPCFEGAGVCGEALASSHFWSLALEMQFYAVVPLVAALSVNQARVLSAGILAVGALVERPWGGFLWAFRPDGLAIGALLAIEMASPASWVRRLPAIGVGLGIFWIVVAATVGRVLSVYGSGVGLAAIATIFGLVVGGTVAARKEGSCGRVAGGLRRIGGLSFSIYLVHLPAFTGTRSVLQGVVSSEMALMAAIGVTTVAAVGLDRLVTAPAMVAGRRVSERICEGAKRETASGSVAR